MPESENPHNSPTFISSIDDQIGGPQAECWWWAFLVAAVLFDADKANYSNYYEASRALLKPSGLIVADNVLWSGKVLDPKDADDHAIVAFDRMVQSDARVENVCLTVRDGMMLAWKRK